jgi:carbonic anhydrase/acetyltransferase-like protein (isoleucine patch superfamily)
MPLYRINGKAPQIATTAFVAAEATLLGEVIVGERASVWFSAVARGDNEPIRIGNGSNVQEGAVLHADPGYPLVIAEHVTVGHQAMLHGCTIGEGSLIGIQAVIMNGAVIGDHSLVGAGAIVTERKTFPPRSLILGAPAKAVRELTEAEVQGLAAAAAGYVRRAEQCLTELERVG